MSGTSYGTVVLHISPEAAVGGPLAIVQNGDMIELDVQNRKLNLLISDEERERRMATWEPPVRHYDRGYGRLFVDHITQANEGCDFDFLRHYKGGEELKGSSRSLRRRAADKLPSPF
jgi:dihydroxy-acid dehydratase